MCDFFFCVCVCVQLKSRQNISITYLHFKWGSHLHFPSSSLSNTNYFLFITDGSGMASVTALRRVGALWSLGVKTYKTRHGPGGKATRLLAFTPSCSARARKRSKTYLCCETAIDCRFSLANFVEFSEKKNKRSCKWAFWAQWSQQSQQAGLEQVWIQLLLNTYDLYVKMCSTWHGFTFKG